MSTCNAKLFAFLRAISKVFFRSAETGPIETNEKLRRFVRYKNEHSKLPGWFLDEAQAVWDCLLCFQGKKEIVGNMLEIGNWKGKSAACSALHAGQDETCVYVDRMILTELRDTIGSIRESNNLFLQVSSAVLPDLPQVMQMGPTFRWIHIDGEHSGEAVRRDLEVANHLLSEKGIICVDDFPSCAYPQINFAVTEFLSKHPSLTMIACGHNKGYICRQQSAIYYLTFIKNELHKEMCARGASVTIWKSGRPSDLNCFGITDRVEMFDYRGPDWNPREISI